MARNDSEPPRLLRIRVQNYRALRDVTLEGVTPLTVLLGPNGSGKSTFFDVFAFLSECFTEGMRRAWDRRGRFKELRTRGSSGPIVFELKYRESRTVTYKLAIDENEKGPYVAEESLIWSSPARGRPARILDFRNGEGTILLEQVEGNQKVQERLDSPEMLAVNTLGQFARHPTVAALRRFISGWYLSYLTADSARGIPEAGPQERLSQTGDNLPNVVQYLKEQHPERLRLILDTLSKRIPRLEKVETEPLADGRLMLTFKDIPFDRPILSKYASDGTLKMLAYLTVLFDPDPQPLIGIEEPENQLHPRLLPALAEECRAASALTQVMVTTHSPFFVNGLKPEELWVLYRDETGYTKACRASEMPGIKEFVAEGALLGYLWAENYFQVGDPLSESGRTPGAMSCGPEES
jgi:predicted ATPase